jgi:hypothetical protein
VRPSGVSAPDDYAKPLYRLYSPAMGDFFPHEGSGDYVLIQNDPGAVGQANWRWCNKCQGLTFGGGSSLGACPAGGQHAHLGSGDYVLELNASS